MQDHGPLYAETLLGRTAFPIEPWNSGSNVVFVCILFYWTLRLVRSDNKSPFLIFALTVLLVGTVGGTVYHATRSHVMWFLMDIIPIMILGIAGALYFWRRYFGRLLPGILIAIGVVVLHRLIFLSAIPIPMRIGAGYGFIGLNIIVPAYLSVRGSRHLRLRLAAVVGLFGAALFFRQIDGGIGAALLPFGTHFLWHMLGALSVGYLLSIVFELEEIPSHVPLAHEEE